ncbi:STAS-like domain-containing protein [Shewanella profunda]|uniref:STAS-like domain-containing protein n=1 Tax=Shewanella profunda TaxID=254793 RepID=UPI00200E9F8B|nr:STAS-like domain-containing protein [Shewanella profunda]MCL1091730.1 STAS-like domain-containing protein [Shewanella profunda]
METSLISLPREFHTLATRKSGASARNVLLNRLAHQESVILDFEESSVSPSFADELIGLVAKELGFDSFKKRVKLVNVSPSTKSILMHVIKKRVAE